MLGATFQITTIIQCWEIRQTGGSEEALELRIIKLIIRKRDNKVTEYINERLVIIMKLDLGRQCTQLSCFEFFYKLNAFKICHEISDIF
jgi:hypothetical protein